MSLWVVYKLLSELDSIPDETIYFWEFTGKGSPGSFLGLPYFRLVLLLGDSHYPMHEDELPLGYKYRPEIKQLEPLDPSRVESNGHNSILAVDELPECLLNTQTSNNSSGADNA